MDAGVDARPADEEGEGVRRQRGRRRRRLWVRRRADEEGGERGGELRVRRREREFGRERVREHAVVLPVRAAAAHEPLDAAVEDLVERHEPDPGVALVLVEAPVQAREERQDALAGHRDAERLREAVEQAQTLQRQDDPLALDAAERREGGGEGSRRRRRRRRVGRRRRRRRRRHKFAGRESELGPRAHRETIEGGFAKLLLLPAAMLGMAAEYQSTLLADTLYCLVGNMIAWVAFYAATYPLTLYDPKKGERIEKPTFAQRLDAADSVFSMPFFPLLMVLALHGTYELWAMGTLHARWHVQLPSTRWFQLLYVTRMATHVRRAAVCSAARRAPPPPMLTPTACSRRADARAVGDAAARPEAAAADEHAPRAVGGLLLRR